MILAAKKNIQLSSSNFCSSLRCLVVWVGEISGQVPKILQVLSTHEVLKISQELWRWSAFDLDIHIDDGQGSCRIFSFDLQLCWVTFKIDTAGVSLHLNCHLTAIARGHTDEDTFLDL